MYVDLIGIYKSKPTDCTIRNTSSIDAVQLGELRSHFVEMRLTQMNNVGNGKRTQQ